MNTRSRELFNQADALREQGDMAFDYPMTLTGFCEKCEKEVTVESEDVPDTTEAQRLIDELITQKERLAWDIHYGRAK